MESMDQLGFIHNRHQNFFVDPNQEGNPVYATEWASGCALRWIMCPWGACYSERGGTPSIMGSYKPILYVTSLVNDCDAQ
jgi:hypothetical protein